VEERKLEPRQAGRDLVCACIDCGRDFTVTEGEREFYEFKKLSLPKRCPACRKERKATSISKPDIKFTH
jgi:transposase-like protein